MFSASVNNHRTAMPQYDAMLLWIVLVLLAWGLVMVYSASIATAEASRFTGYRAEYYLMRHGFFILVGVIAGIAAFQISMEEWQKLAPYLFAFGVLLLALVLIPGVGREVNGSRRWLSLLGINLQPSELMKLFAVLYASQYAVRKGIIKEKLVSV
ncbi:MAG: FtsW/RodA/SpoVE family cell cycle protein, partial [Candidatus Nitrotoga sp.]